MSGLVSTLPLLRKHAVLGLEVMPGMGDELPVARMVHGLHTDDLLHQGGIMTADVLDELSFRIGCPVTRTAPASAIDCATA